MKLRVITLIMIILLTANYVLAQDKKGSLKIITVPDNATVMLDDQLAGTTPLTLSTITEGKHRLVIKKEGYQTVERVIEVPADEIKKIEILLTEIKRPEEETPSESITPEPEPMQTTPNTHEQDKKTQIDLGLRLGSYTPSSIQTQPDGIYEDSGSLMGIDLTIGTHNPNLSWRISLDKMTLSGDYSESYRDGFSFQTLTIDAELEMTGISVGVMGHSPRTERVRWYGGGSLGSYSAKEKLTISTTSYGSASDSANESAIGFNLFGGVLIGSPKFGIGLEIAFLSVKVDNSYGSETELGGMNFAVALNAGF